jgi:NAD(P)H-hydrate epimerase
LHEWSYAVKVWIVRGENTESSDFKVNLERLRDNVGIFEIVNDSDQGLFADRDVLIDAIFGSGLSRPTEGIYAQAIRCINKTDAIRIAVDMPSGLLADSTSSGDVLQAHHTVSFQLPKLSFLFPESRVFVGAWHIVDIGLDKKFIQDSTTDYFLLEHSDIQAILHTRKKFNHKGNFGHALLIAGSHGKMGAAILGARAAMRSGLGLLTVHVPTCGYAIIQTSVPEAMVSVDNSDTKFSSLPDIQFDTIGIGPGIGTDSTTVQAFTQLLEKSTKPLVMDADALNILGAHRELIHLIPKGSILTPHPKEFERLVGESKSDFDRLNKLKEFAIKTSTVVLLKGAH